MKAKFEQIKKISAQFSFGPKPQLIQVELDQSASPGFSFTAKPTEFEEVERLKNHPCFEIPLNSFVYDKADYPRADTVAATTTTKGKSPKGQKKAPPTEVERASWVPPTSCPVYREKLAQDMVEALQDGSNAIDLPGTRVFKGWQKMTRQNLEFVAWKMIV